MATSAEMSSLGDRAWWAYQCLPRDKFGALPATTALETKHDLSRGLIGKLHNGRQHTVDPDVGERLAKALQTSYDFLVRGLGAWPSPPVGLMMPPRVIKYARQGEKLERPVFHTVKPDHQLAGAGAAESIASGDLDEATLELAAAQVKVRRPEYPMATISAAVRSIAALRHAETVDAESVGKLAELVIMASLGEIPDKVISGLLPPGPKATRKG